MTALSVSGGTVSPSAAAAVSGPTAVNGGLLNVNGPATFQASTVTVGENNAVAFAAGISPVAFGGLAGSRGFPLQDSGGGPVTLQVAKTTPTRPSAAI